MNSNPYFFTNILTNTVAYFSVKCVCVLVFGVGAGVGKKEGKVGVFNILVSNLGGTP